MGICAYCKQDRKLTREHLLPDWVDRANPTFTMTYLGRVDRLVNSDPVIKDVCDHCNSTVLSKLDDFAKTLWGRYFANYVWQGETVLFEYEYDPLARWLLKVVYNSARANRGSDSDALASMAPYILGTGGRPFGLTLALSLIVPHQVSRREIREWRISEDALVNGHLPPAVTVVGGASSPLSIPQLSVCRRVILRSYDFLILAPGSLGLMVEMSRENNAAIPLATKEGATVLYPKRRKVSIRASDTTSYEMMRRFIAAHPSIVPPKADEPPGRSRRRR